jgi:hypothetical protein
MHGHFVALLGFAVTLNWVRDVDFEAISGNETNSGGGENAQKGNGLHLE